MPSEHVNTQTLGHRSGRLTQGREKDRCPSLSFRESALRGCDTCPWQVHTAAVGSFGGHGKKKENYWKKPTCPSRGMDK